LRQNKLENFKVCENICSLNSSNYLIVRMVGAIKLTDPHTIGLFMNISSSVSLKVA